MFVSGSAPVFGTSACLAVTATHPPSTTLGTIAVADSPVRVTDCFPTKQKIDDRGSVRQPKILRIRSSSGPVSRRNRALDASDPADEVELVAMKRATAARRTLLILALTLCQLTLSQSQLLHDAHESTPGFSQCVICHIQAQPLDLPQTPTLLSSVSIVRISLIPTLESDHLTGHPVPAFEPRAPPPIPS